MKKLLEQYLEDDDLAGLQEIAASKLANSGTLRFSHDSVDVDTNEVQVSRLVLPTYEVLGRRTFRVYGSYFELGEDPGLRPLNLMEDGDLIRSTEELIAHDEVIGRARERVADILGGEDKTLVRILKRHMEHTDGKIHPDQVQGIDFYQIVGLDRMKIWQTSIHGLLLQYDRFRSALCICGRCTLKEEFTWGRDPYEA